MTGSKDLPSRVNVWMEYGLCVFAFGIPVSIAVGEPAGFIVFLLWLLSLRVAPDAAPLPANPFRMVIPVFVGAVFIASALGVNPIRSFDKITRFALMGAVFAMPVVCLREGKADWDRIAKFVACFLAGITARAAYDCVRFGWALIHLEPAQVETGIVDSTMVTSPWQALFAMGNMRDPQMYLVSTCLLVAALVFGLWPQRRRLVTVALVLNAAGLLVHFKRGAWIAFAAACLIMLLVAGNRRALLIFVIAAVATMAVPQVRERLSLLRFEFTRDLGGRFPLWTEAAPKLIRKYPTGLGWKTLTYERLRSETPHVQRGLNHLHNTPLQILVELGWAGLVAWLLWMGRALWVMVSNAIAGRREGGALAALSLGVFGGFAGLMINGCVEYNFGDTEIFMLLSLLMSCAASIWMGLKTRTT